MAKKKNKRIIIYIIVTFFILGLHFTPPGIAANNLTTIKGWFANIKIFSNNKEIKMDVKPFVIEGTTYVPVRFLGEMLNKEVGWNQAEYRIDLTDKPDENFISMQQQNFELQKENRDLKTKIKQLESKLESKKAVISNIKDMEKYLDEQYNYYNGIRFYVYLAGDAKDVKVRIYVDSRDYLKWDSLLTSEIESYIGDIIDDIKYNFKNAVVSGYIESDYTGRMVADFNLDTRGKLYINTDYAGGIYDLDQMADYLNKNYSKYNKVDFNVKLYWDLENIRVDVFVGDNQWFELGSTNREKYLKEVIYKEIKNHFPYEGIYGYVLDNYYSDPYSNYVMQSFAFDSNGKLILE